MILKFNSYIIGKAYEKYVVSYLQKLYWNILTTNYKTPYGEIDIIAIHESTLIACEIKARKNNNHLYYSISKNNNSASPMSY